MKLPFSVLAVLMLAGCVALMGGATASSTCSYDEVWDTAIVSLGGIRLDSADKAKGALETTWVEGQATTRAGILQREINRERVKYLVEVSREGTGARVTILQRREAWSPMGNRMRQWRAIPGNPAEEQAVAAEMTKRLKEKGC